MNAVDEQLPFLTDDDVKLLDAICKHAESASFHGPIKAVIHSQDALVGSADRGSRHYGVIMRWLFRVGEAVATARKAGDETSLILELRHLLEEHGIEVTDTGEDEDDELVEATGSLAIDHDRHVAESLRRRRVSFDDARYEETWLSTHSNTFDDLDVLPSTPRHDVLPSSIRPRSAEPIPANILNAGATPYQPRQAAPPTSHIPVQHVSEEEEQAKIDAFDSMRQVRAIRACLEALRQTLHRTLTQARNDQIGAAEHDRLMLLKQSLNQWQIAATAQSQEREFVEKEIAMQNMLAQAPHLVVKSRVFYQWLNYTHDIQDAVEDVRERNIRILYFYRWREITERNLERSRQALVSTYFRRWLRRTDDQQMKDLERAVMREDRLSRKYFNTWLMRTRASRHYKVQIKRKSFRAWLGAWEHAAELSEDARTDENRDVLRRALRRLTICHSAVASNTKRAESVIDKHRQSSFFALCQKYTDLLPRQRAVRETLDRDVQREILTHWQKAILLQQKAKTFDRKRLLTMAIQAWSDALRVQFLKQQVNARIARESYSRVLLESRLRLSYRTAEERLKRQVIRSIWDKMQQSNMILQIRTAAYNESSTRIQCSAVMRKLHSRLRAAEDDERLALEMHNMGISPSALIKWKLSNEHVTEMNKWAVDAEFYVVVKKKLKLWREKTKTTSKQRERQAHDQVRTLIKARLARFALTKLRTRMNDLASLETIAGQFEAAEFARQSLQVVLVWRARWQERVEIELVGQEHDDRKLAESAWQALHTAQQLRATQVDYAAAFALETDQGHAIAVLRKLRFTSYSSRRLEDNASFLQSKLQDRHYQLMLRRWFQASTERRGRVTRETPEPESPSIRPASRAASRMSQTGERSPRITSRGATPAYLRTPSHGRKRFRGLPTPAPYTPFTPGFITTTPAPFQAASTDTVPEVESFTPQITPFDRKLRAGGIQPSSILRSRLRNAAFSRSITNAPPTTGKSVRFTNESTK